MLLFFDGCGEYYDTAHIGLVWDSRAFATVLPTGGRRGGPGIRIQSTGWNLQKSFPSVATVVFGAAFKFSVLPPSDTIIAELYGDGVNHLDVYIDTAGHIGIKRGATDLIETITTISAGAFFYIEVKVLISNTVGTAEIQIDGVSEASDTGLDTNNGGNDFVDALIFRGISSYIMDIDDVYILDTTGSAPQNDFLGDVRVDAVLPDGDGFTSQFDTTFPASPTTHYTKVDENPATADTDYNESATVNDVDLFDYAALPTVVGGSDVFSVKALVLAKKTDAGDANLRLVTRPISTNFNGSSMAIQTDYRYHFELWDDDPQAAAAWTDATIDAAEFGVEVL